MAALNSAEAGASRCSTSCTPRSHASAQEDRRRPRQRREDHWEWHMFDTVKGSDYLGDQDAIEVMCREAIDTVYELEHMGLPFNRTPDGKIDQRPFGGHTKEYGKAPVKRACFAADRTGHMILQTLYQQCIRRGVTAR